MGWNTGAIHDRSSPKSIGGPELFSSVCRANKRGALAHTSIGDTILCILVIGRDNCTMPYLKTVGLFGRLGKVKHLALHEDLGHDKGQTRKFDEDSESFISARRDRSVVSIDIEDR